MNSHYKVYQYSKLMYWFTSKRSEEECLVWIKDKYDYLDFYTVKKNDEVIFEKKKSKFAWK